MGGCVIVAILAKLDVVNIYVGCVSPLPKGITCHYLPDNFLI
jgi:hypothetical protein